MIPSSRPACRGAFIAYPGRPRPARREATSAGIIEGSFRSPRGPARSSGSKHSVISKAWPMSRPKSEGRNPGPGSRRPVQRTVPVPAAPDKPRSRSGHGLEAGPRPGHGIQERDLRQSSRLAFAAWLSVVAPRPRTFASVKTGPRCVRNGAGPRSFRNPVARSARQTTSEARPSSARGYCDSRSAMSASRCRALGANRNPLAGHPVRRSSPPVGDDRP